MLLSLFYLERQVFSQSCEMPIEIGRQSRSEQTPYYSYRIQESSGAVTRIVVAKATELQTISRRHALLKQLSDNKIQIENLSKTLPILIEGTLDPLLPGETGQLELGNFFVLGDRTIRLESSESEEESYESLMEATIAPGKASADELSQFSVEAITGSGDQNEHLLKWLSYVVAALQSAASATEFLSVATKTAKQICRLDSAHVVMRSKGPWSDPGQGWDDSLALGMSRRILKRVAAEKRTIWQIPSLLSDASLHSPEPLNSFAGVQALIASPILDREGEVIGVLYGDRRQDIGRKPIHKVEAMLIEIVAAGLAGGLTRLEEEQAAVSARVLFEQFFTPDLSKALQANPKMLEGREAEISVLFCDVRGFSRISERLGPAKTVSWMNDVMGALAECVLTQEGVLVDFVGDELMAMWGAPQEISNHADRACLASLDMLHCLKTLNERWQEQLGEPIKIGIGINTGRAQVGNTGSKQKFKYGPLGHSVNLASRVQTATKNMNAALLITGATQSRLSDKIPTRRLHRVKVRNIQQDVDLYEVPENVTPEWSMLCRRYEAALTSYETGEFDQTLQKLGSLLAEHPLDGPTRMLLSRTTESMSEGTTDFNPVWELP